MARIVVLDLTDETHGNANGVGLADIITRRLHERIDFEATYANVFTSTFLNRAYIPVVMETDRAAIEAALSVQNLAHSRTGARRPASKTPSTSATSTYPPACCASSATIPT